MPSPILEAIGTSKTAAIVCEMLFISPEELQFKNSQSSNNKSNGREDHQNLVQSHAFDKALKHTVQSIKQAGRQDSFAESDTAHCQEDNTPVERVEVVFREDASPKEGQERDDSNHAHISNPLLKRLLSTPQTDSDHRHDQHKVVLGSERVGVLAHLWDS